MAPGLIARFAVEDGSARTADLLRYTGLWNQGFAKVFASAILRTKRLSLGLGIFGIVIATAILLLFLAGHLTVDLHGFGAITFAQSAWFIWVGVMLGFQEPEPVRSPSQ